MKKGPDASAIYTDIGVQGSDWKHSYTTVL